MLPLTHIVIGFPTDGHPECEFMDCMMRDTRSGIITDWFRVRSSFIEDNRNTIVANFRHFFPDDEHLLMIDDDVFWPPEVIPLMIEANKKYPIVAMEIPLLSSPVNTYKWNGNDFVSHIYQSNQGPVPFQCDGVGTGMMMIHSDIWNIIPPKDAFNRMVINDVLRGEDISFCNRLRLNHIRPYVIPGYPMIHYKTVPIQRYGLKPTVYNK